MVHTFFKYIGAYYYHNGDVYEGEMFDTRNGKGTLTCANGDKYEGEWKNDKKEGKGTVTLKVIRKRREG